MSRFAVLKNAIVINVIIADTKETAETATGFTCVEHTIEDKVDIGDTWDGSKFNKPIEE
jgi:hypothetical protein